jgi:hypothetical protein
MYHVFSLWVTTGFQPLFYLLADVKMDSKRQLVRYCDNPVGELFCIRSPPVITAPPYSIGRTIVPVRIKKSAIPANPANIYPGFDSSVPPQISKIESRNSNMITIIIPNNINITFLTPSD